MPTRIFHVAVLLAALAFIAFARPESRAPLFIQPDSRLWVEGTSNLRSFRCTTTRIEGRIVTVPGRPGTGLAGLGAAVRRVEVAVPLGALECGHAIMNQHMRQALRADESPRVRYRVTSHRVSVEGESEGTVRMNGALSLGGRENPVGIDAAVFRGPDGALRVRGAKRIRMSEFGLLAPRLMGGVLVVEDLVTVHFDVVLKP